MQEDSWLSNILGKKSFSLRSEDPFRSPSEECFVFTKVPTDQITTLTTLQSQGLRLIDTNVVFEKKIENRFNPNVSVKTRLSHPSDEEQVVELARRAFSFTRFHLDPLISNATADSIKAEWTRNFFLGKRGQKLVVAELGGKIVGFNLLLKSKDMLTIDLIAVDEKARGRGVGQSLIGYAESLFDDAGTYLVGTQIANQASIRLYEKMGFRFHSSKYVLHGHFPLRA